MTWTNLKRDILEDVAETAYLSRQVLMSELHEGPFVFDMVAGCTRQIKRRRPEEMLDQLREFLPEKRQWGSVEILKRLGWVDNQSSRNSVGRAMVALGWFFLQDSKKHGRQYTQTKPEHEKLAKTAILAAAFEHCSSYEICSKLNAETSGANLTRVGMILRNGGWTRYKTRRGDGGVLWKWVKE